LADLFQPLTAVVSASCAVTAAVERNTTAIARVNNCFNTNLEFIFYSPEFLKESIIDVIRHDFTKPNRPGQQERTVLRDE
jgi:hypothetical protein